MASERREIRPYVGLADLERQISDARLVVGGEICEPGSKIVVSIPAFLTERVELEIGPPTEFDHDEWFRNTEQALESASLEADEVEFVLIATTPRLKLSEVSRLGDVRELAGQLPRVLVAVGPDRPASLSAPHGGYTVDFAAVLNRNRDPRPLSPTRRGTWLARSRFAVRTDLGDIGFTPRQLTDEVRSRHNLNSKTMRLVLVEDPLSGDVGPDGIELYVDELILAEIAQAPHTPGARALQRQFFLDAMSATVITASKQLEQSSLSYDEIEGSIVGRILDRLTESHQSESERSDARDGLLNELRSRPSVFLARVESLVADLIKQVSNSIRGGA